MIRKFPLQDPVSYSAGLDINETTDTAYIGPTVMQRVNVNRILPTVSLCLGLALVEVSTILPWPNQIAARAKRID
jgi:hypothetical protein